MDKINLLPVSQIVILILFSATVSSLILKSTPTKQRNKTHQMPHTTIVSINPKYAQDSYEETIQATNFLWSTLWKFTKNLILFSNHKHIDLRTH